METQVEEKKILQLKICSARKLLTPKNAFVQIEYGNWNRQTGVKKHTERPLWNQLFVFPVENSETQQLIISLKHKDGLGKNSLIGKTNIQLPQKINELADIWVELEGLPTDVHICMQLELLGDRSFESLLNKNTRHSSLMRFSSLKLLGSSSTSLTTSPSSSLAAASPQLNNSEQVDLSSFSVKAGVVTLNEIIQALDRIRGIVYLTGTAATEQNPSDRQVALQAAKLELDDIGSQIEKIEGLTEEWKDKLSGLILDYSQDCWMMLYDEAWANVSSKKHLSRLPPPLPSKETIAQIRKERLSMQVPPPPPSGNAPKPPTSAPPVQVKVKAEEIKVELLPQEEREVLTKPHFLSSLQVFDHMMDFGFAVEFPNGKGNGQVGKFGDVVTCKWIAYIYDGALGEAISYDLEPVSRTFPLVDRTQEDVPKGLTNAFLKIPDKQDFCVVTVTPQWGFGDDGHEKGVPPNSTLIFEISQVNITSGDAVIEVDNPVPEYSLSKERLKFPARDPMLILEQEKIPAELINLPVPSPSSKNNGAGNSILRRFSSASKKAASQLSPPSPPPPGSQRLPSSPPTSPTLPPPPIIKEKITLDDQSKNQIEC